MNLTIQGHSDDIVGYELGGKGDELYLPDINFKGVYAGTLVVKQAKGDRLYVHVIYDGCWSFAVSKVDEDDPDLPSVDRSWRGYSEVLSMNVNEGTKIKWKK